jgi:hypothetical protein
MRGVLGGSSAERAGGERRGPACIHDERHDQLDGVAPGLMEATLARAADGRLIRKAGVMAIVVAGGEIGPGDAIQVEMPAGERRALVPV